MLNEDEIRTLITQDKMSNVKNKARKSREYYEGKHDIKDYRIFYYNAEGEIKEDKSASNIRISHPFFSELADQQVQYMLSGKTIYKTEDDQLNEYLKDYFNDNFKYELMKTLTNVVVDGFGYMYAYTSENGKLRFQSADTQGVIEVRAKDTNDNCDYIIYRYMERESKTNRKIWKIQVWDEKQTYFYTQDDEGKIELDKEEEINPRPHVLYDDGTDMYYKGLGFIPFFRIRNNDKWLSDLWKIKDLIDDYDLMACGLSNNLIDFTQAMYVVKGFEGDNLDELVFNVKNKKAVGVAEGGDVSIKTIDIPYQARQTKLELDEKNIYKFGMGFNSAQVGDGNVTNVVIKSRYALLDLKCNKLETHLFNFLNKLLRVILREINETNGTNYQIKNVEFCLERIVITNEMDNAQIKQIEQVIKANKVETLLNAGEVLDEETLMTEICKVLEIDADKVKKKLEPSTERQLGILDEQHAKKNTPTLSALGTPGNPNIAEISQANDARDGIRPGSDGRGVR